jgi:hypothetical protein
MVNADIGGRCGSSGQWQYHSPLASDLGALKPGRLQMEELKDWATTPGGIRIVALARLPPFRHWPHIRTHNRKHAFLGGPAFPKLETIPPCLYPNSASLPDTDPSHQAACKACPWALQYGIEYRSAWSRLRIRAVPGFANGVLTPYPVSYPAISWMGMEKPG